MSFNYTVGEIKNSKLDAKLTFDNPNQVSALFEKDLLVVSLIDFRDNDGTPITNDHILQV